jgi:hypothetical protein
MKEIKILLLLVMCSSSQYSQKKVDADKFYNFTNNYALVKKGNDLRFIDTLGNVIPEMKVKQNIQYIFSTDYGMQGNNIYITKEGGSSGIKNIKGEFIFEPFYNIESFYGYFILKPNLNSKKDDFIIINKNGKIIYKEKNTSKKQVFPINDEIFATRYLKNNYYPGINNYGYSEIRNIKTGKVTERVYSSILPEINGLIKSYRYNEKEGAGKWGFLDENFKTAIDFIYTNKPGDLIDNRILVKSKDRKYGFVDKNGKLIIEAKFLEAKHFVNGYAMVKLHKKKYSKESKKYNYGYRVIDVNGRIIRDLEDAVPATLHSLKNINAIENEGVVRIKINQKKGFPINYILDIKSGEIIETKYRRIYRFNSGLALVEFIDENKKMSYGYINKKGELKIVKEVRNKF